MRRLLMRTAAVLAEQDAPPATTMDELVAIVGQDAVDDLLMSIAEQAVGNIDEYMHLDPDDRDGDNQNTYNFLKNCGVAEYLDVVIYTDDLEAALADAFEDELDPDADLVDDALDRLCTLAETTELDAMFDDNLRRFLNDHAQTPGFNTAGEYVVEDTTEEAAAVDDDAVTAGSVAYAADLADHDDRPGDVTELEHMVDVNERDQAFVYIDGEVLVGSFTHGQLVNSWLAEQGLPTLSDDYETRLENSRPMVKQVQRAADAEAVAWGHVAGDVALVEGNQSCTLDEVAAAVAEEIAPAKVYEYIHNSVGYFARRLT